MGEGCFHDAHVRMYMHLEARWLGNIRAGIAHHLNTLLFKHSEALCGVVVAYHDVALVNSCATLKDEYPALNFYIK